MKDDGDLMHFSLMAIIFISAMVWGVGSYFYDQRLRAECEEGGGFIAEVHTDNILERNWICTDRE